MLLSLHTFLFSVLYYGISFQNLYAQVLDTVWAGDFFEKAWRPAEGGCILCRLPGNPDGKASAGRRDFRRLRPEAVPIQKLRREAEEEGDGNQAGRDVAERFSGKGGGGGKEDGEKKDATQKEAFAEQGAEEGQTDLPQGGGHVHAHPLDGHEKGTCRIDFYIPHAPDQGFAIRGEEPDELGGEERRSRQHEEGEAGAEEEYAPESLLHPLTVPGPQVEADGPLAAQGDAAHGPC